MTRRIIECVRCLAVTLIGVAMIMTASAQDNATELLVKSFQQYRINDLQEKIFAHTDRTVYSAGEIIWFKLYATDANFNKPLDLSKVAYVEIMSRDMKPVMQAKIALRGSTGEGSFLIPFSLLSGNYVFRAYTNWMKNYSADGYFEKMITVVNSLRRPDWPKTTGAEQFDIQFFPEGGNLVNGLQSKLGFRIVDQQGRGRDAHGAIINANKDTVARFSTRRFGLGQFLFTPQVNQSYTAVVRIGDSIQELRPLPVARENGYVLAISETPQDQVVVTVSATSSLAQSTVYLFVQSKQQVKLAEGKALDNTKTVFTVDRNKLDEGISHFTLFNASRQPIAERVYFKQPKQPWVLGVTTDKQEYGLRQKVNLAVHSALATGQPEPADLSLSVFLQDSLQRIDPVDIQTYFLLSSELKGSVESPAFYFGHDDATIAEQTEDLMLTHGWTRFKWEDVLQQKFATPEFLPEYDGHIVTGRITDRRSGLPAPNLVTYLSVPGIQFNLSIATSNAKGELRYDLKNFYGSKEIVLQAAANADSIYRFDMANPFSEKSSSRHWPAFLPSDKWANDLLYRSTHAQVENNFLIDKKEHFLIPARLDSFAFYGKPDKKYFLDDYTRYLTMEEVMREYIQEVRVRKQKDHFRFAVADVSHGLYFFENEPLVLLDGVPVFDIDKIVAFDPLKIKKIEVVANRYFHDSLVNQGIVSYTTYNGNLAGFQLDPNALILEYAGLQLNREFFSPVYESSEQASSRIPDFRNLLYWSPSIDAGVNGGSQLSFYTSDIPGRYVVVTQGISDKGYAVSSMTTFTVKR